MGTIECCKGENNKSEIYKLKDRSIDRNFTKGGTNNNTSNIIINDNIKVNFEIYLKKRLDKLIDFDYSYCFRSNKNIKHKRRILLNTEGSSRRVHFFSYSPGKIPYLISSITIHPNIHVKDVKFLTKENSEFYALILQEKGSMENVILINCLLKKESNKNLKHSMYSENFSNNDSFQGNDINNNNINNEESKDSNFLLIKPKNNFDLNGNYKSGGSKIRKYNKIEKIHVSRRNKYGYRNHSIYGLTERSID